MADAHHTTQSTPRVRLVFLNAGAHPPLHNLRLHRHLTVLASKMLLRRHRRCSMVQPLRDLGHRPLLHLGRARLLAAPCHGARQPRVCQDHLNLCLQVARGYFSPATRPPHSRQLPGHPRTHPRSSPLTPHTMSAEAHPPRPTTPANNHACPGQPPPPSPFPPYAAGCSIRDTSRHAHYGGRGETPVATFVLCALRQENSHHL